MTLLDHMHTILEDHGPKVSCTQNILGNDQPIEMTDTCSNMETIQKLSQLPHGQDIDVESDQPLDDKECHR
jgi:hypothetical protein